MMQQIHFLKNISHNLQVFYNIHEQQEGMREWEKECNIEGPKEEQSKTLQAPRLPSNPGPEEECVIHAGTDGDRRASHIPTRFPLLSFFKEWIGKEALDLGRWWSCRWGHCLFSVV